MEAGTSRDDLGTVTDTGHGATDVRFDDGTTASYLWEELEPHPIADGVWLAPEEWNR